MTKDIAQLVLREIAALGWSAEVKEAFRLGILALQAEAQAERDQT